MNSSTRVIINTMSLYLNMVVTLAVQLIALRLIIQAMGKVDYAIYSIVGGSIVALLSFMNVAMSAATQRYLSYAIGEGDRELLKETFYISVVLHLAIGFIVVLLLEGAGLYYVYNILKAPAIRIGSAAILLHCITASTLLNIITVPYEADINANENMTAIAVINIFDSLMKLATAIYLIYTPYDKLIVFGVLTMSSQIITLLTKRIYCLLKYAESHIKWHAIKDYKLIRNISSFAMWNLIGTGCSAARYQGTPMIMNNFFGIIINAAYGVAQQVNGLLLFFANTIVRAIRPQIVKSEGSGDRERMLRLSITTCRITSLMVAILAIPLFVEMELILRLWLGKEADVNCVSFCRCFLVIVFINQLTIGLQIAIESVGKIKSLQYIVGTMHILALPVGWLCYKIGLPAVSIMICIIIEEVLAIFVRAYLAKKLAGLNPGHFLLHTILPCTLVVALTLITMYYTAMLFDTYSFSRLFIVTIVAITIISSASYYLLLTEAEKSVILGFASSIKNKIIKR